MANPKLCGRRRRSDEHSECTLASCYVFGGYDKKVLHSLIVTAAKEFYNNCLNKNI